MKPVKNCDRHEEFALSHIDNGRPQMGELEGTPEEELVTLIQDDIHPTIPLEEFLNNLALEKRNPFDPNAVALEDGDALALDEESDEDEDRFIL